MNNNTPIKLVIADDNKFFVDALADSLTKHEEFTIVGKSTSITEVINFTQHHSLDVLILDVNFKGINSLDYIDDIKKTKKNFKIISLTTMNNNFIKLEAKEKGVDYFVGKDSDLSNFKPLILDCFQEGFQKKSDTNSAKIHIDNLIFTKRKLEILQALYSHSDKNGKVLSKTLNITESALKSHKRDLFEITNTKNTTELIKFGIQHGLIVA